MYGLTDERYKQLVDNGVADYTIEGLIRYYGRDVVQKGYMQCRQEYYNESSSVIPNAWHIEHVSQLAAFDSDWDACRQAEKDGIRFINDMDGLEKGFYIDTPENRKICTDALEKYPDLRIENWLDIEDGEWGSRYSEYFLQGENMRKQSQHVSICPEQPTRRLHVTIMCQAVYDSGIDVPADLSFEEALEYAKEHIAEIPLGTMEYIPDSDVLDEENCDFEEEILETELDDSKNEAPDPHDEHKRAKEQTEQTDTQQQLIDAVLGYLGEHNDSSELYRILHEELGMTHEEIELLGFDLPQCYEDETGHIANTRISYLYRDADNYKMQNECIIEGVITKEQQEVILNCLDNETYFIPSQVGLPETRFGSITEADHCWFELDEFGFETTPEEPTVKICAEDLVKAFCERKDRWEDNLLQTTEKEDLLEKSRLLTVGNHVEYHGYSCEIIHVENDVVYLQENSSDLHFEVPISAYLDSGPSVYEGSQSNKPSLNSQIQSASNRATEFSTTSETKTKNLEHHH